MHTRSVLTWASTGLVGVLASVSAHAQSPGGRPDAWHGGWGWGWGHMVFGSLMMLLFWGAVMLAIVIGVRWLGTPAHRPEPSVGESRALAILEERLARGEIDADEFEQRKRVLSG